MLQHEILGKAAPYREPWGLRFNAPDAASAVMAPANAPTDPGKWTIGVLLKRGPLGSRQNVLLTSPNAGVNTTELVFEADNTLRAQVATSTGGGLSRQTRTNAVFRDPTAPLFIVMAYDNAQATAAHRLRLYVNSVEITSFSVDQRAAIANTDVSGWNAQGVAHYIGRTWAGGEYLGAHVLQIINVDGQQLDPGSFETVANGIPRLKRPNLVYGANGWHLDFNPAKYGEAVTLANVLKDRSGNGNHFTGTNLDATSTDGNLDHLKESATPKGDQGNHATLNPVGSAGTTLANGNLETTQTAGGGRATSTLWMEAALPTRFYGEAKPTAIGGIIRFGLLSDAFSWVNLAGPNGAGYAGETWLRQDGNLGQDGALAALGHNFAVNDVIMWARKLWLGKNGAWFGGGDPAAGTNPTATLASTQHRWAFLVGSDNPGTETAVVNFGQRPFAYAPPSGFKALHTGNLPKPAIRNPAEACVNVSGLGSGIEAALAALRAGWTGPYVEFFKNVSNDQDWKVRFSDDAANMLACNTTAAKAAFTAPTGGDTYRAFALRIGAEYGTFGAEVAHVNGAATNVAHGLGAARKLTLAKRSVGGTGNWFAHHPAFAAGKLCYLNLTDNETADASIAVDATNVTLAAALPSGTYRVLVVAEVAGFSALGYHEGNGNADGPLDYAGFRPALYIDKRFDASAHWRLYLASSSPQNPWGGGSNDWMVMSSNVALTLGAAVDRLATGVKVRNTGNNISGGDYAVIQIAEAPLVDARAV